MINKNRIDIDTLARLLRCSKRDFPRGLEERLLSFNTNYRLASRSDIEEYVLEILKKANSPLSRRNRQQNLNAWEVGWNENLEAIRNGVSEEHLVPKYFRPSTYFRFDGDVIIPEDSNLEHNLFDIVRLFLFHRYFRGFEHIYEMGCGSCQNLYMLSQIYCNVTIFGLDWAMASNEIANLLSDSGNGNIKGVPFDMFNPPMDMEFLENSIVFSIHALEQLNYSYDKLIDFLLNKKPSLVLHYEPILEFYDSSSVYDYLSILYSNSRGYLTGFMTALRQLAQNGRIEILEQYRPYIGGIYHEASIIVWRPL